MVRALFEDGLDHYGIAMRDPEGNEFDINLRSLARRSRRTVRCDIRRSGAHSGFFGLGRRCAYRNIMDGRSRLYRWSCRRLGHCGLAAVPGRTRIGGPGLAVYGSVGLDRFSALRAEKRLALGPGPQESVDDQRESHLRDFACGLDRSVSHTLPGLGLDFGGHGLPPVIALGRPAGFSARAAAS
ncbi:MAG: hypothetical protein WAK28_09595 [Trebonia sp.]